jgi:hypothetical protein
MTATTADLLGGERCEAGDPVPRAAETAFLNRHRTAVAMVQQPLGPEHLVR